jgi:methylation protein EvaC
MRYTLAAKGTQAVRPAVERLLRAEREQKLDRPDAYEQFRANCENSRARLMELLEDLRAKGKRVVGYGATSKSTTVTNYCGITPAHISFISDTTPIKQGKLSPGAHVPVRPYEEFRRDYPDYALLFAWNHSNEILEKETEFVNRGGKWIYYVPKVEIVA